MYIRDFVRYYTDVYKRQNRPYVQIDQDVLERVRQIDLLSYLREFEPSNLVTVSYTHLDVYKRQTHSL